MAQCPCSSLSWNKGFFQGHSPPSDYSSKPLGCCSWKEGAGLLAHPFSSSLLFLPLAGSSLRAGLDQGRSQLPIPTQLLYSSPLRPKSSHFSPEGLGLRQSFLTCNGWMNTWMANQPLASVSLSSYRQNVYFWSEGPQTPTRLSTEAWPSLDCLL